jgi:hypothetical protein
MSFVTRLVAFNRGIRLRRQLAEIQGIVAALPARMQPQLANLVRRELDLAGQSEFPHLYGTPPEQRYIAWGTGSDTGLTRARSDSTQARMRGVALWVAVVFHETRGSSDKRMAALHRSLIGLLRQFRDTATPVQDGSVAWMNTSATA